MVRRKSVFTVCLVAALVTVMVGCGATPTPQVIKEVQTQVVTQMATQVVTKVSTEIVTKIVTATPAPINKVGGTFVWGAPADPVGFNPILNDNSTELYVYQLVSDPLTWGGENYPTELKPYLATSWETSADGLIWTIHLRPNVKWSDGVAFTADDVIFWAEAIQDPKTAADFFRDRFYADGKPHKFEKVDDLTVKVTTAVPVPTLLNDICVPLIAKHYFDENNVSHEAMATDKSNTQIILGTGPFKLTGYARGESITLERNDNYWGDKAYLGKIVMRIIPDPQAMVVALQTGELDWTRVQTEYVAQIVGTPNADVQVHKVDGITNMLFNVQTPVLADKRTRQALVIGLDRQAVINGAALGYGVLQDSVWCWVVTVYKPQTPDYKYDPDKAKQMLADVGWKPGADGILVADTVAGVPAGTRFTIQYVHWQTTDKIPTIVQSFWKNIGVEVNTKYVDLAALLGSAKGLPKPYDVVTWGMGYFGSDPSSYATMFGLGDPALSYAAYDNKQVDDLFSKGKAMKAGPERDAVFTQAGDILWDELPFAPLFYRVNAYGVSKKVHLEETDFNVSLLTNFTNPEKIWKEK